MHCLQSKLGPGHRQRGAALIVAMLVFALCAAIAVAMSREFTLFSQRAGNLFHSEQAYAYLRGAEELATLVLVMDYDQDQGRETPRDDLKEDWARPPEPFPLDEGGWWYGSLEDLQGRFNLNRLIGMPAQDRQKVTGVERFTADQAQFIRLLQALEDVEVSEQEAISIAESIADWLDPDSAVSPNGAEDDYYFSQTPAYRVANRPMSSASELRAIANMTPEIFIQLSPWVTVWPQTPEPLNIHTAGLPVLRSINSDDDLSPLSEADAQTLWQQRDESGFEDLEEFLANPVFEGKKIDKVAPLLGESSKYFRMSARVEIAGRELQLYSVLRRAERRIESIVRASGSL